MERVKRLTLDINERLEEEDYQDMLASVCISATQVDLKMLNGKTKSVVKFFVVDSAPCNCQS